jgi:hypothetical protein
MPVASAFKGKKCDLDDSFSDRPDPTKIGCENPQEREVEKKYQKLEENYHLTY